MAKHKNDLFIAIIFSLIWVVSPISYDEMRNRNQIYPQEIQTNISNKQQNASLNKILSKHNSTNLDEVILVKNDGLLPGADSFSPPFPKREGGRTTKRSGASSPSSNSALNSGGGNLDGNLDQIQLLDFLINCLLIIKITKRKRRRRRIREKLVKKEFLKHIKILFQK